MWQYPRPRWLVLIRLALALAALAWLPGCGTLAVEIEQTPTPDLSTATVAALQQENLALNARVATLAAPQASALSLESDSETIRRKLLYSTAEWHTLWADAVLNTFTGGQAEPATTQRVQLWISQPDARFRLVWSSNPPQVDGAAVSDGETVRRLEVESGQISGNTLSAQVRQAFIPPAVSTVIVEHPLQAYISSPLAAQLLSTTFGQRSGKFTAQSMDVVAERNTLVVDWNNAQNDRVDRLWVDAVTGVVLRWQNFGKNGGVAVASDYAVTAVQFDAEFPSELFDQQLLTTPFFAGTWQGNPVPAEQSMVEQSNTATDEQGELYFVINNPTSGERQLVSLPGHCLDGTAACPEPRVVEGAPVMQDQPVLWSPTGRYGLVIDAQSGIPGNLLRYDPEADSWSSLAVGAVLAAWSPDGRVVAYASAKDVYLILAEGSSPRSLTSGQIPMTDARISWLGWQDTARLLLMVSRPAGQTVYLVDVPTGTVTEVLQRPVKGGTAPEPSPDGQRWAMVLQQDGRSSLLINAAGSQGSPFATYANSTIWPLGWSPDGDWVAYNVYSMQGESLVSDLYVARGDGSSLQMIHRGEIVPVFTWSPDSRSLVVGTSDGQGYTHLILIQIEDGQSRVIQAPGLNAEQNWILPAWRK